jgi:DNA modification methylase
MAADAKSFNTGVAARAEAGAGSMPDRMFYPGRNATAPARQRRGGGPGKSDGNLLGFSATATIKRHGVGFDGTKGGPGGTLWQSWTSDPRFDEQKTAAEARLGRTLSTEEFGRDYFVIPDSEIASGTSIFDPVLSELAYRWFCPPGGLVLDPFAGGSVRGIVASKLGRQYVGIELRPEQIAANRAQAEAICGDPMPCWHEGDSRNLARLAEGCEADFVFSCPPYGDLERYSDDERDLSTMGYAEFLAAYREIIAAAIGLLKPDRFACFVVGDLRDKAGCYRGFPWHTCQAFEDAGARLYNEAVLLTAIGSLPIRVGKQFEVSRKLGKTHQNVLVFVKGDPRKATAAIGACEMGDIAAEAEAPGGDAEFGEAL